VQLQRERGGGIWDKIAGQQQGSWYTQPPLPTVEEYIPKTTTMILTNVVCTTKGVITNNELFEGLQELGARISNKTTFTDFAPSLVSEYNIDLGNPKSSKSAQRAVQCDSGDVIQMRQNKKQQLYIWNTYWKDLDHYPNVTVGSAKVKRHIAAIWNFEGKQTVCIGRNTTIDHANRKRMDSRYQNARHAGPNTQNGNRDM
jgi:hypothetical protein